MKALATHSLRWGPIALAAASWVVVAAAALSSEPAPVDRQCEGADVDPWVSDFRSRVAAYHSLYAWAVGRFGPPAACEGRITTEFDGTPFGVVSFEFANGVRFTVETMPPETSITTLRSPDGLGDAEAARQALRDHAESTGLSIDWSRPEVGDDGGEVVHTFRDPDPGLNASGSLIFVAGELVGIRLSMAL